MRFRPAAPRRIDCETLLLWGERDPFLVPRLASDLEQWVPELDVVKLSDAGHWLQLSNADQVNEQILTFLRRTVD